MEESPTINLANHGKRSVTKSAKPMANFIVPERFLKTL